MSEKRTKTITFISGFLVVFGLLSILSGGRALFTEAGIASRGNIVPLVLWFNFIAGFFYVAAGIFSYSLKGCVRKLSTLLAITNGIVLLYLLNHIYQGDLYETRTLLAMTIRTTLWIVLAFYFSKSPKFTRVQCNC